MCTILHQLPFALTPNITRTVRTSRDCLQKARTHLTAPTASNWEWTKYGPGGARVALTQDTDKGTPIQELHEVEAAAEDPVGGSTKGDLKGEESL